MQCRIFYDSRYAVRIVSDINNPLISKQYESSVIDVPEGTDYNGLIGKKVVFKSKNEGLRLAFISNHNQDCGISTYNSFLIKELRQKLADLKIFSEIDKQGKSSIEIEKDQGFEIEYCWKRGESMLPTIQKIKEWGANRIFISHEFGLFPKAQYFLSMMEAIEDTKIPSLVTLHSVYSHLDKSVCTSQIKNVVVHSESAKKCLESFNHINQKVTIINHGCFDFGEVERNWPFVGNHSIIQFGFGFSYKGVENTLEAIAKLKNKYPNIFYCYLCSENSHTKNINDSYYNKIKEKIKKLDIENHATIQRGFLSDEDLNQHLRTYRLAVFGYITDPKNVTFGASGSARIAMANKIPVISSASSMFDDLEGILPRPGNSDELAKEIDLLFSDKIRRENLLKRQNEYLKNNSWEVTADRYLKVLNEVKNQTNENIVLVEI